jgi:hypothetical protein
MLLFYTVFKHGVYDIELLDFSAICENMARIFLAIQM